jgi:hypothetical protein
VDKGFWDKIRFISNISKKVIQPVPIFIRLIYAKTRSFKDSVGINIVKTRTLN